MLMFAKSIQALRFLKVFKEAMDSHGVLALVCCVLAMLVSNMAVAAAPWGVACADGRVDNILDNFDSPWDYCCTADPLIPKPTLRTVPGCNGNALAVDYDLRNVALIGSPNAGQSWIVLQKSLSPQRDLTPYTHIRLAIRGSNLKSHDSMEVKLKDANGLVATVLRSMTDLPEWRAIYIDLRELTGNSTINLAKIVGLEIAIVRCAHCEVFDNPSLEEPPDEHVGTLFLDEFAVVNFKPGGVNRLVERGFEKVTPNSTVRASAARALLTQIARSGAGKDLIPAWFPEQNPNFNSYSEAVALLVLVYEYERTGDITFRAAAQRMAAKLLALQIQSGRQSGAWYSTYVIQNDKLSPPGRASQPIPCDGNEALSQDIDTCEWVGNVGWVLIALGKLQRNGLYDDPVTLTAALDRGAAWVSRQFSRNPGYPNLISLGIEGNISAYFGLLAAGKVHDSTLLGSAILQFGWDPLQRRMKPGVLPADAGTAIDVSGSWGVTFLRSLGRIQEALDSQAYAASMMRVSSFDGSTYGYGDIAGPYTPAVEFTAQAASAGIKEANVVMQQISLLQIPAGGTYPGAFPGAADHWYGGPLTPWDTTMVGVSPTAWVYFAQHRDPLVDLLPSAQVYLQAGGQFTLADRAKVYGSLGRENVLIQAEASEVILDQNVERVDLAESSSSYLYQQSGNTLKVFSGTTGLVVTVTIRSAGTQVAFTDGAVTISLAAGVMTLGGAVVTSTPRPTRPPIIDPDDPSRVGKPVSHAVLTIPQGSVFLSAGNRFTLLNSAKVYGSTGTEQVLIGAGVAGITLDQNVERLQLAEPSSSYLYQQAGNTLKVFSGTMELLLTVPIQSAGTEAAFTNGVARVTLAAGTMFLGGARIPTATPGSVTPIEWQTRGLQWRGVNLSGAEFGEKHLPGTYGRDYIYPSVSSVDYFKAKGMNLVRLPFRWERLQPSLNQPFDIAELARLQSFVSGVTAKGVAVLLDPHNFARYQGQILGSSGLSYAAYADFWSRLSALFKDNPRVLFGLMNEPHDMPTETWVNAANAAIQGIRATGATNTIMIPGNAWTGAWSWTQNWYGTPNAEAMKKIVDSGNNIVFEVHQYLDSDSSGTSATCVSTEIGVERLKNFTEWLRINRKRGFLGEFAGANNETCKQAVSNMLTNVEANADVWLGWAWWSAGPWWGDYMFSIEPGSDGIDKPQMSVLTGEPSVKVVKYRGSLQCMEGGKAPEVMQNELTSAGIDVLAFSCGTDGYFHIAVCGASDGRINIFVIPRSRAAQAQLLGFSSLSDWPDAREITCR
ncbi:glycoside hydrolase family 5 protein [Candidatus Accumulibacter vicinus]|uniref:Endoglucanase n=1 Tax=Candidatus Accumulibacter vicinus TaxID=2954382 RepID=A0A084Y5S1_9PROT|nr:MAG: Endoglucanase precursor [Candidatus Accumulibacter vicinus]